MGQRKLTKDDFDALAAGYLKQRDELKAFRDALRYIIEYSVCPVARDTARRALAGKQPA